MEEFKQIVNKELSTEEELTLFSDLDNDSLKRDEYIRLKNLWSLSVIKEQHLPLNKKKEMFENFWHSKKESISHLSLVKSVWKYAAIFILVLFSTSISFLWINHSLNHKDLKEYAFSSSAGSISSFKLSDGSQIWLNAQSNALITEQKNKVLVKLEGEALFDVIHNEDREFLVDVGNYKIRDLGTRFNIRAYAESDIIRTTLIEGNVSILGNKGNTISDLEPGQAFLYNKSERKVSVINVDSELEGAWHEGKFVFIDKTLLQIVFDIEKWYNVDVVIKDEDLANTKFTSVIQRHTTIKQVLDILKSAIDINYKIETKTKGKDLIIIY